MKSPLRILSIVVVSLLCVAGGFVAWLCWSSWPDPSPVALPWTPDAVVVLGGGDLARAREGARQSKIFPEAAVLLTGDNGRHEKAMLESGVSPERLLIERKARSTWENAALSGPILEGLGARRVVIVTNWYHVPRAEAVFRKQFPGIAFASAFEPAPSPFPSADRPHHRRERFAAIWYALRYGVLSF